MPTYQEKPVEAIQWTGENFLELSIFCNPAYWEEQHPYGRRSDRIRLLSLGSWKEASKGDWIIKDACGCFRVRPDDIFHATFDIIEEK